MFDINTAERQIRELHSHYTDAVFRKDVNDFGECFTSDGEWRISGRVFRGRPEICEGISLIMDRFVRVLISFRAPVLAVDAIGLTGRTYIDEQCSWKNGTRNMNIGRYYERFAQEDGRWRFKWRLFELLYRGPPDLSGTFYENTDYGPPPAMPPMDADTADIASPA